MKFSLWPSNVRAPADLLEEVRAAEGTGWHGVWLADHYMPNTGDGRPARGDTYECWALLPALAAVTERVRIGTLVSPTSVHHPALLAKRASTIDRLSGGRMVLGLGAGWQVNEHRAYGIELEPPGKRVSRFAEAIQIVRSMLADETTTFHGAFYDITDAPCDPKPVQSPLPLLVGTRSPRMLQITARHADEWNTWGTPEQAAGSRAALIEACGRAGRDPATMRTSVNAIVDLGGSAPPPGRASLFGSAQQLIDQFGRYAELGFDEFVLPDWNLGAGSSERADKIARIKTEVMDQVTASLRCPRAGRICRASPRRPWHADAGTGPDQWGLGCETSPTAGNWKGTKPTMQPTYGDTGAEDFPRPTRATPIRPRSAPAPFKLVSYYERDSVLNRLKEAFGEGRLDDGAFDYRMRTALTARTQAELEPLVADLPGASRPPATAARPARFTVALRAPARRAGRWRVPGQHVAIAYKGRGVLDLRAAELTSPVTSILAVGFESTIRVIVPPGIHVRVTGAGIGSDLASSPVPSDAPVVRVRGFAYKGTVEVLARPR